MGSLEDFPGLGLILLMSDTGFYVAMPPGFRLNFLRLSHAVVERRESGQREYRRVDRTAFGFTATRGFRRVSATAPAMD